MGIIYCLTSPSGTKYIGKTSRTLEERVKSHVYESFREESYHRPIYKAINKYGIETFKIEILAENIDDQDLLSILEIEFISNFKKII